MKRILTYFLVSLILVASVVAVPSQFIPSVLINTGGGIGTGTTEAANISSSTVGTGNDEWLGFSSYHRQVFYAVSRIWVFYSDDTDQVYRTSLDGVTWTSATVIAGNNSSNNFNVCFDGTYFHCAFTYGDLNYRRCQPNRDGTLTWTGSAWIKAYDFTGGPYPLNPSICVNSDGIPVIAYRVYNDATHNYPYVTMGSTSDGTWGTPPDGFPYQLSSTNGGWREMVVPYPNDGAYMCIYHLGGSTIKSNIWTGSTWCTENATTTAGENGNQVSAVITSDNTVHMVFNTDVTYDFYYTTYDSEATAWSAEATIFTGTSSTKMPVLTKTLGDNLICFWTGEPTANHLYYMNYYNGTWDRKPTDWITTGTLTSNMNLTVSPEQYGCNYIFVAWSEATSNPRTIKCAGLERPEFDSYLVSGFEDVHAWAKYSGSGTWSDNNSVYSQGVQSFQCVTAGDAAEEKARWTTVTPKVNCQDDHLQIDIRVSNPDNLNRIWIYAASTAWTAYFCWKPSDSPSHYVQGPNEWVTISLPWSEASITGSPDEDNLSNFQLYVQDKNSTSVTVWFDNLRIVEANNSGSVSVTFDDGWESIITEGYSYMNTYSMPGCVYASWELVGDSGLMTVDNYTTLFSDNWEIGGHYGTNLDELADDDAREAAVSGARDWLDDCGFWDGYGSYAYPGGVWSNNIDNIVAGYFASARTICPYMETDPAGNVYKLRVLEVADDTAVATITDAIDECVANQEWLILVFHRIIETPDDSLEYSIANFQDVIDYLDASDAVVDTPAGVIRGYLGEQFFTSWGVPRESFDTVGDFFVSGTGAVLAQNTTLYKEGTGSVDITSTNAVTANANKVISENYSETQNFTFWVYVPSKTTLANIRITMSENSGYTTCYYCTITDTSYLLTGWNHIDVCKAQFSTVGSPSWDHTMIRLRFSATADTGQNCTITFDDFRTNLIASPIVIITFDDLAESQYDEAYPILEANNQVGTIFAPISHFDAAGDMTSEEVDTLYEAGWDVGGHGWDSLDLTTCSEGELHEELNDAYDNLTARLYEQYTMAYPYNGYSDNILPYVASVYPMARTVDSGLYIAHNFLNGYDEYHVRSNAVTNTTTVATVEGWIDNTITRNSVLILNFHVIVDSGADESTKYLTADFQDISDYIAGKVDDGDIYCWTMLDYYLALSMQESWITVTPRTVSEFYESGTGSAVSNLRANKWYTLTNDGDLDYFLVSNQDASALDILISGTDWTGSGVTWTLSQDGTAGDAIIGILAGVDDADDAYDLVVRDTQPYDMLYAGFINCAYFNFSLKILSPTDNIGNSTMTGIVTLTVLAHT